MAEASSETNQTLPSATKKGSEVEEKSKAESGVAAAARIVETFSFEIIGIFLPAAFLVVFVCGFVIAAHPNLQVRVLRVLNNDQWHREILILALLMTFGLGHTLQGLASRLPAEWMSYKPWIGNETLFQKEISQLLNQRVCEISATSVTQFSLNHAMAVFMESSITAEQRLFTIRIRALVSLCRGMVIVLPVVGATGSWELVSNHLTSGSPKFWAFSLLLVSAIATYGFWMRGIAYAKLWSTLLCLGTLMGAAINDGERPTIQAAN